MPVTELQVSESLPQKVGEEHRRRLLLPTSDLHMHTHTLGGEEEEGGKDGGRWGRERS